MITSQRDPSTRDGQGSEPRAGATRPDAPGGSQRREIMAHKVTAAITFDVTGQTEVDDLLEELADQANGFRSGNVEDLEVTSGTLDVTVVFITDHTDPRAMVNGLFVQASLSFIWPASKVRKVTVLDVVEVEDQEPRQDPAAILADLRRATEAAQALLAS